MKFEIYGEFAVPRNGHLISRAKEHKRTFWDRVEEREVGLSQACGCYVFVIRNRAWYVGMAEKQSFKQECFALHKITQYNEALAQVNGNPSILLLPKLTPSGLFASPTGRGHADIRLLENLLIGTALGRNPALQNVKGTRMLRDMNVPGFLNSRQGQARANVVQSFKRAVGA